MTTTATPTPTRLRPTRIAPETFVVHKHQGEGTAPVVVALNSMVIRGRQPVVVDTGAAEHRDEYLDDVFSLVEPEDVRWVFISHDDVDHTGNVNALMARCPRATLVINWFTAERMGASLEVPPTRWRWVSDGEGLDVGDRVLRAVRPPVYDSPTTRGLFDPTTGTYWSSDAFATPLDRPVAHVEELDRSMWEEGMATFANYVSPWLRITDAAAYQATVDRVAALQPTAIVGCHTPVVTGERVDQAIAAARRSPTAAVAAQPDQAVLDAIVAALPTP